LLSDVGGAPWDNLTNTLSTYNVQRGAEIYRLLKAGAKCYSMPDPSMDLEDMGVAMNE